MATLNPLLDPPTTLPPAALQTPQAPAVEAANQPPNLMLGVLRRWPWLVLGLAVGLVLGLLYHMQRAPVYQSTAQLMVIKNRPDMISGGAGDSRVQYVEDYVAPQVILLTTETILKPTAEKQLNQQQPFQAPLPESIPARIGYMSSHFTVVREKEQGSNAPSNVLQLNFKASHPADAPRYLRAIIAAYKDELTRVYESASTRQIEQLEKYIGQVEKGLSDSKALIGELEHKLHGVSDPVTGKFLTEGISQEELPSIRQRISNNRTAETNLKLRQIVVDRELADIKAAGNTRAQRLIVMTQLGIVSERPSIFIGDAKDPDSLLATLKFRRADLSSKFGSGHPDMVALNKQITALEEEIEKGGGPREDELERYRRRLEHEQTSIAAQLKELGSSTAIDERKAQLMAPIQQEIETLKATNLTNLGKLQDAKLKEKEVSGSMRVGGYEVNDVSKPTDGVQVAPVLLQSLLLGAVVGLVLGCGLGLRAELADRGFRSPADIRRRLGLSVLGHVPPIRTNEEAEIKPDAALDPVLVVFLRPRSAEAEAVRGIRTQLLFSTNNRVHQVIQITSPNTGDGKSTIAANLAVALARADKRVVLVDCDFRKPRVHKMFGIPNPSLGIASVVADQADLGDVIQPTEIANLSLLPCGPRPSNPAELLSNPKFLEVLNDLRTSYDYVLLDTPPILAVSDPAAVASRADGVILVFRMSSEAGPASERAKEELTAVSARILGVVVNASTERDMGYGYGYGYRYDYQYTDSYADKQ